jgi:acyl phosphate:glycerol-3-phosphate acyltransferase
VDSLLALAIAYVAGSLSFATLVARSRGVDIRAAGSGNPGATNVGRVLGKRWGRLVLVLDILKGLLPVLFLRAYPGWVDDGRAPVAAAAVIGHIAPLLSPRHGGKGVATFIGASLGISWVITLAALALHAGVRRGTGFVSVASVAMAWALPGLQLLARALGLADRVNTRGIPVLAGLALVITLRHAANFVRIRQGTEARVGAVPPSAGGPAAKARSSARPKDMETH